MNGMTVSSTSQNCDTVILSTSSALLI